MGVGRRGQEWQPLVLSLRALSSPCVLHTAQIRTCPRLITVHRACPCSPPHSSTITTCAQARPCIGLRVPQKLAAITKTPSSEQFEHPLHPPINIKYAHKQHTSLHDDHEETICTRALLDSRALPRHGSRSRHGSPFTQQPTHARPATSSSSLFLLSSLQSPTPPSSQLVRVVDLPASSSGVESCRVLLVLLLCLPSCGSPSVCHFGLRSEPGWMRCDGRQEAHCYLRSRGPRPHSRPPSPARLHLDRCRYPPI